MIAAVYVLYILNCMFLILVVLLQAGKGDSMGAVFGGASNTLLGNRGAATFLSKLTVLSAILFMLLSIVLAYHSSAPGSRVGRGRVDPSEAPAVVGPVGDEGMDEGTEVGVVAPGTGEEASPNGTGEGSAPATTIQPPVQVTEGTGSPAEGTGQPVSNTVPEGTGTSP